MPYKSYMAGRKHRKRFKTQSRWKSTKELAWKAVQGVAYLKGLVNAEMKRTSSGLITTVVTDAGVVLPLFEMAQGLTRAQRIGISIKLVYMRIIMSGSINTSATETSIRVIVFVDKQQVSDSDTDVVNVLASANPHSPINFDFGVARFRILMDRYIHLEVLTKGQFSIRKTIPLNVKQQYNGSAATDIQKNGIYILLLADEVTNDPTIIFHAEVGFRDN